MKIKAGWVLMSLLVVLAGATAFAEGRALPRGQLTSEIEHRFVGDLGETDDEGRLLVWEGTIDGAFTGEMKWWFVIPPPVTDSDLLGGRVVFYSGRWEIWDGDRLLLAGESSGKTYFPENADGIWDGHGVVTEASRGLNPLKGRKVYESGPVELGSDPPFTYTGTGMFVIY